MDGMLCCFAILKLAQVPSKRAYIKHFAFISFAMAIYDEIIERMLLIFQLNTMFHKLVLSKFFWKNMFSNLCAQSTP